MAISSPGIGSGLDIDSIITKLMAVEQQPLLKLATREASYQTKISSFGSLQGAVSSLNTAVAALKLSSNQTVTQKFSTFKASVADSSASATATTAAASGSYSLQVQQLATTHRISTVAVAHTLSSGDYANAGDPLYSAGEVLTIDVDGTTTALTLTDTQTSLDGLAAAINARNAGIAAEVVTDDNGAHLVFTSNTAGTAGKISLSGLAGLGFDSETETGDLIQTQAASGGYTSATAAIDEGTLQLSVNGTSRDIVIDSENNTLAGLRDAINDANAGVTATLTTVGAHDVRLVLTSNTLGSGGKIGLSGLTGFGFDAELGTGDLSQAAADGGQVAQGSKVLLNGLVVTGESNTLENVLDGVTLKLNAVSTTSTTLTVTQDKTSTLNAQMTSLVKAYNDYVVTAKNLGGYDAENKRGGPLLGNATLRATSSAIQRMFQTTFGEGASSYRRLSDIGLEIQKDGTLTLDSSQLSAAAVDDFDTVAQLAARFGEQADTLTDGMLGTQGTITAASDGAQASIKSIDKQRETLAARLTQVEARYRRQFSALDSLIASMNTTASYLTQQLANLPGASSS